MSPIEIATLKFFSSEQCVEFVTFNQIFSIFFGFRSAWGFHPDLTRGSVLVWTPLMTEPTLLSPPKQIPGYAPDRPPQVS